MDMRAVREAIGRRMEAAAKAHGLGAKETAEQLGEAVTTVRQWWAGTRLPPAEKADRYAALFGQEAGYFYAEELWRPVSEAELGISPGLWAQLCPPDRQAMRAQALVWARVRGLAREAPAEPTTDE